MAEVPPVESSDIQSRHFVLLSPKISTGIIMILSEADFGVSWGQ